MNSDQLAVYGGEPALSRKYRESWRKVRLRDLVRIARCAYRDENTSVSGSGPIGQLERAFCKLTQAKYAIAMNSGTATLHSAYFAVGVRPGDEVIVPSYTFVASASPVLQLGATPVFCDIDERTLTADPDDVERRITSRTRAICVVHVWGNPARLDRFVEIARKNNVALIEDCSHAHGATYQEKPVGSWGDVGCYSLQGSKPVSAGEGGIVVTNDAELHDRMLALGHLGRTQNEMKNGTIKIENLSLGVKYRPHLYGVLLAIGSLERLDELNRLRRRNYEILAQELADCAGVSTIESYPGAVRGGLLEFILRYDSQNSGGWNRGAFVRALKAERVPVAVDRYTKPGKRASLLPETPLFSTLDLTQFGGSVSWTDRPNEGDNLCPPISRRVADQLITMPPITKVSSQYMKDCAAAIKKVVGRANAIADLRLA